MALHLSEPDPGLKVKKTKRSKRSWKSDASRRKRNKRREMKKPRDKQKSTLKPGLRKQLCRVLRLSSRENRRP